MRRTTLWIVVAVTLVLCRDAAAQCTKDTDCKGNRICVKGACQTPGQCTKDADCSGQQVCDKGKCIARATPAEKSEMSPADKRKAAEEQRRKDAETRRLAMLAKRLLEAEVQQTRLLTKWRQAEEQQVKTQRAQLAKLEAQWKARWAKSPKGPSKVCLLGDSVDCAAQCAAGSMESCYSLALMFLIGRGGPTDLSQAALLFAKTCNGGNTKACSTLASMLELGKGVPRDLSEACRRGSAEACRQTHAKPALRPANTGAARFGPRPGPAPARPSSQARDTE